MKSRKSLHRSALLSAMILTGFANSTAMAEDSGWYVGANAGHAQANIDADRMAADLIKYRRLRVELQGHTDSVGGDAYNLALSRRRALT